MHQLVFARDRRNLFHIRLQNSTTKIGRSARCDVVLTDPEISREHAAIFHSEGQYLLKQQGQGSIQVNGSEQSSHVLKLGDKFQIGPWEAEFQTFENSNPSLDATQVTRGEAPVTQAVAGGRRGYVLRHMKVVVQRANETPKSYSLGNTALSVGADPKNDIVLDDSFTSSRHLKIVTENDEVWVCDLGSTNGTILGGIKIRHAQWDPDAIIKVGQCQLSLQESSSLKTVEPLITDRFFGMVGETPVMQKLYGELQQVGPTHATVLVLGESGVGKELVAQAVHALSTRASGPFVALNCGAISKELIESELFGHEKGAFTGAGRQHDGAFGQAKGGTLFLDEIGELPLDLQPKLLRVLENRTYRRVGGSEELNSDVRIVAATHRDLAELVRQKAFREDLFFRLFVLPLPVPRLRDHLDDIPLLTETFLKEFSPTGAKPLTVDASQKLRNHPYPGNVRELRNVILRASLMARGKQIEAADIVFPDNFNEAGQDDVLLFQGIERLEEMEKKLILQSLVAHKWNKAQAAQSLGIAKSTLFSKIKLYQLEQNRSA